MSGYKKDDKLLLDIGPDAIPLLVSISKVQHTAQGPIILDVDTRTSRGVNLVPANFKLKVFDRRYAYELRDRLRTGSWTNDRDHIMLRDAMTGSLDTFLTEWSRDARLPADPRSVEMSKREAILWELMRRQYHSDLAMHQALQARNTQSNPRLISTGLIHTGTTMDYVLSLMYNNNQYFNVSCLLLEENEGAAPFSDFPTLPTNQDYHLGLSVFNDAGIHSHAEPSQAPGSADSGTSDPEDIKPGDDTTQEGDSAVKAVEKPTHSKPHALGHPLTNRRHRSEYSPLPMEVRQITIGVGEEYPRQPRHYRPPRRINDSWSIRKNLSTGSVSEF